MPIVKNTDQIVESMVDGELLLMNIAVGRFQGLKGTGLAIWRELDRDDDVARIKATLAERYDIAPAACAVQVDAFLAELEQAGLVLRS